MNDRRQNRNAQQTTRTTAFFIVAVICDKRNRYNQTAKAGPLLLEDVVIRAHGGPNNTYTMQVAKDQHIWARQLNTEAGVLLVNNSGGKLWVLGQKTEQGQSGANDYCNI